MAPHNMTSKSGWYDDHHHGHRHENLFSDRHSRSVRDHSILEESDEDDHYGYYMAPSYRGTGRNEMPAGRVHREAPVSRPSKRYEDNWGWEHSPIVTNRTAKAHRRTSERPSYEDSLFRQYTVLAKDKAYKHAQNAGTLWQTLVGQHVKFPSHWWNGARAPAMGQVSDRYPQPPRQYRYIARHKLYDNPTFGNLVPSRSSSGRLLLHAVVRDSRTGEAVQDVAIGCLHPNARGIRTTQRPDESQRGCREIWMATRKRLPEDQDFVSAVIDPLLTRGRAISELANESPLGSKNLVNNRNMREVFGDNPPLQTVFITEIHLNEIMLTAEETESFAAPALVLLREYLFP